MGNVIENIKNLYNKYNYHKIEEHDQIANVGTGLDPSTEKMLNSGSNPSSDKANELEQLKKNNIFPTLSVNLDYIKEFYTSSINSDIAIRDFIVTANNKQYPAALVYIDGMVNSEQINEYVLEALMLKNRSNTTPNGSEIVSTAITSNISVRKVRKFNLEDYILNCLIPQNSIEQQTKFEDIISDINSGNCMLFIDTLNCAYSVEVKGFERRSVSAPQNEVVIRGSQEAFVEAIRINTSLIRRIINNENLIIESSKVGTISKTNCAICYIKNIANDNLVNEVKKRVNNLNIDYIISSGQLEQLIEDNALSSAPQMLATERPDKATAHLLEGRVVILVNGSPYALIAPSTLIDFLSSPEDTNLKFQYANLLKFTRLLAFFISLLLPGLYIAISNFHHELIPTELLFAIAASRETLPFPVLFEILLMEVSFELIREAGARVPSPIGPTIGIVGGLILGQAAVSANIVSPILIIIVAITGISSFAVPDFFLGFNVRLLRFVYIFLGAFAGFLGIGFGLFIHLLSLANLKSFGVPYLSPYAPASSFDGTARFFLSPIWKREKRPDYLNAKKEQMQPHISMDWSVK